MERIKSSNKTVMILLSFFLFLEIILLFFVFAFNNKIVSKYISSFDLESYLKEEVSPFLEDKRISKEIFSNLDKEKIIFLYEDIRDNKVDNNYISEIIVESIRIYEDKKDIRIYDYIKEEIEGLSLKAQEVIRSVKEVIDYYNSIYIYLLVFSGVIGIIVLVLFVLLLKNLDKKKYFALGILFMVYSFMLYNISKLVQKVETTKLEVLKYLDFRILQKTITIVLQEMYFVLFVIGLVLLLISFFFVLEKIVIKIRIYLYDKFYGG